MDKNLLHTFLTEFNKLNKRRKHTFVITSLKMNRTWKLDFWFQKFFLGGVYMIPAYRDEI